MRLLILSILAATTACTSLGDESPFPHRDAARSDATVQDDGPPPVDAGVADAEEPDA